ncbi:MAG: UDP-N-acetylglucosamine 1-carboxyvinyltransferase [Candidatus Marinimicrobia bacterium]|nr:UDP-N-acetylglucosamine 1-carboxyvinyltransferase [Candidatus Neomarinimicrobiota bacterium]
MEAIRIQGGVPLYGEITIGGAKNAALPLMVAGILSDEPLILTNMPELADIDTMVNLLRQHGVQIDQSVGKVSNNLSDAGATGRTMTLAGGNITNVTAPYDLVRRMRASILVLGPLLARKGEAKVSLPGGCAIGTRPVDLHLKALESLGARIALKEGYIQASAPHGLKGANIVFPKVSVGATENLLMAAALADGVTVLENAAREPEITNIAECLNAMGAQITGLGTGTLRIKGVKSLNGARVAVIPDRIETGTYAIAAAITRGRIVLKGTRYDLLESVLDAMRQIGVIIEATDDGFTVSAENGLLGIDVMTEPFPGFPTDMQAQWMALMATATGAAMITETIFENRFMHVPELTRFGVDVNVHGASAIIRGVEKLSGAPVMATDLRASSSLVLAGLAAVGETFVNRVYHLDRGYERLEEKLGACGARIERLSGA